MWTARAILRILFACALAAIVIWGGGGIFSSLEDEENNQQEQDGGTPGGSGDGATGANGQGGCGDPAQQAGQGAAADALSGHGLRQLGGALDGERCARVVGAQQWQFEVDAHHRDAVVGDQAVELGIDSVMYDGSHLDYAENVATTAKTLPDFPGMWDRLVRRGS